jgi:ABC-type multidrug transport system ATPase subunit
VHGDHAAGAVSIGFVPQDDIVHRELPLRRTLLYAARLRLPAGTARATVERTVDETLARLDLGHRAGTRVAALSGGERKRASIAVELLTRPALFFLDEPTSGLDPAAARGVLRVLRRLTSAGTTVVMTTHDPTQLDSCDRVVGMVRGGRIAVDGAPSDVRRALGIEDLSDLYDRLASVALPQRPDDDAAPDGDRPRRTGRSRSTAPRSTRSAISQWAVLCRRNVETMLRNRLTLAVMVGSPVMITAMMVVLFRPGSFTQVSDGGAASTVQTMFWLAFAAFFFGLTYGLLQVVGELQIVRREHRAGVGLGPYLAAKAAVLVPLLAAVAAVLVGVLTVTDRLPPLDAAAVARLMATMLLASSAALALGLLASAAVQDASQATLALPMLCFPQVLFAGAVVPDMAPAGEGIGALMVTRWTFESLGRTVGLSADVDRHPALSGYTAAFDGAPGDGWWVLVAMVVVASAGTYAALRRKVESGTHVRR